MTKLQGDTIGSGKYPNQDRFFIGKDCFGIFDGVGGSRDGAEAAEAACEFFKEAMQSPSRTAGAGINLAELFEEANALVLGEHPHCQTTAVVAQIGGNQVTIAHVGDSRAYRHQMGFGLLCLTLDHSLGDEDERSARADQLLLSRLDGTEDSDQVPASLIEKFKSRNVITAALGLQQSPPTRISTAVMSDTDTLVLTTDGVHDNLTQDEIAEILGDSTDPSADLVQAAWRRANREDHMRSKPDDITAVALEWGDE